MKLSGGPLPTSSRQNPESAAAPTAIAGHGIGRMLRISWVEGTSIETIARKRRALVGFFRYAVTRRRLNASPMPSFERKRGASSFTPYIFSEDELPEGKKQFVEANKAYYAK